MRLLVDRIPGPDEEAKIGEESKGVGGSAANVAIAARRLGFSSSIIAKIGLDDFGRIAVDGLLRERVDISGLSVSLTEMTGFSIVARTPDGSITIYSYKGASESLEPGEVREDLIARAKFIHIASLRPDTTRRAIELAKKHGVKVSWDPGRVLSRMGLDKLRDIIESVDIILVNRNESRYLTGEWNYRDAARTLARLGPWIVVVKLGGEGSFMHVDGMEKLIPPVKPDRVLDTTGAGDAYAAALIAGLLRGYDPVKAAMYASVAASIKVSRLGSHDTPTHEEVMEKARLHGVELD
ncbi:MAG: carbohydrate kinase family protein [Desulfurococcales archaeon]|nr:carbohydrate kinase family protein [Desulfurococcales archaeon]